MLSVALTLALAPLVVANGSFETYGADLRARAMANSAAAVDAPGLAGYAAAHTNPAAVGRAPSELVFGAAFSVDTPALEVSLDKELAADDPYQPARPAPVAGITLGFLLPVDLVLEDRLFVGAVGFFPTQVLVRARAHDPQRPFFYAYDSATDHYDLSLALGGKLVDWAYLGVGTRLSAGQKGDIQLAADPVRQRISEQSVDTFQYPTFSPTLGILLGPFGVDDVARGSLGVVYREPSVFDVELPAALNLEGADVNAVLATLVHANYSPRSITAAVGLDLVRDVTVDMEAQYAFWSAAPAPFVITGVDLGGEGLEALGLEDGLDAPAEGQERVGSPGFVDTVNVRAGVEWRVLARHKHMLALRTGYQYRPTPVPDQTSGTNIIDCTTHIIGAGFALTFHLPLFAQPVMVEAAYQGQLLQERTATKSSATDAVGDWTARGSVHALALGYTYRF